MKKNYLIMAIACINVLFAFLLIHKQNKIITLLYEIQQLRQQREQLLETKKNLLVDLYKEEKLSKIQRFAEQELEMKPITINETKTVTLK